MNPEIKAKWLAELRDPKNKQTKGKLKARNGARCCIGVLCEIIAPNELHWVEDVGYITSDQNPGILSSNLLESVGLRYEDQTALTRRNDGGVFYLSSDSTATTFAPHSFPEIADYIEKEL